MNIEDIKVGRTYKAAIIGREGSGHAVFALRRVIGISMETGNVIFAETLPETSRQCSAEHFAETALRDVTEEGK